MGMTAVTLAAALGLASVASDEMPASDGLMLAQAQPFVGTQGRMASGGNYMTLANGCTYRKTQAPGYPPRWILVVNPHHMGRKVARAKCKGMM